MASEYESVDADSRVDILLATCNGAAFVAQQIESVVGQMGPRHRLLIRDDGSGDDTPSIVRRFAADDPRRIILLNDQMPSQGACQNFTRLLASSDADYLVLCDQDDVWLPGHISQPLARIRAVERQLGAGTPVLAHTDLQVVDENLHTIAPSFWSYSHLDPYSGSTLNRLLVQNVVTGCATMINRALARLASPIPTTLAPMHDWWLALVASAFGRIETVPAATVLYRQHPANHVGATCYDWRYVSHRVWDVLFCGGVRDRLRRAQTQARALLQRFRSDLSPPDRSMLGDFLKLRQVSPLCRRRLLLRHGFFGSGKLRNLGWLLTI